MTKDEIKRAAVAILEQEYAAWKDGQVFVTEKVYYNTRDVIQKSRKNFRGIFEQPINPLTGKQKTWIPLTETSIDTAVKNTDLDTKDIIVTSNNSNSQGLTPVVRAELARVLNEIGFGEKLDMLIRTLGIDGTAIWKTVDEKRKDGLHYPKVMRVDILNFFIDPTAESISLAPACIERALITRRDFMGYDGWINKDKVKFKTQRNADDENLQNNDAGTTEYIDIFERRGIIPKYLITGRKKDTELVEGRIDASRQDGGWEIHNIEEIDDDKPREYEEAFFIKIPNQWRGRSIAEKLFDLQYDINEIVNTRRTRNSVSQLGLWKIKENSGITPQAFKNLPVSGAIKVQNMEDIEQLEMQDASASSYQDEEQIRSWANRTTSSYEAATGEALAASTPATNGAIQANAAQSTFALIREGIGMFLERWIKNQVMPIIAQNLTKGHIVHLTGEMEDLKRFDESLALNLVYLEFEKSGANFTQEDVDKEVKRTLQKLQTMGNDRYVKLIEDINIEDFNVKVRITSEKEDSNLMTQRLTQVMAIAPEYRDGLIRAIFDLMQLDSSQLKANPTPEQQKQLAETQATQAQASQEYPVQDFANANTIQGNVTQ